MKTKRITQVDQRNFVQQLKAAVVEKDVETAYKGIFQKYYDIAFTSPYGTDGFFEPTQQSLYNDGLRLLLEVKFQHSLTKGSDRAKIIAQAISYVKKFKDEGRQIPNVIVGGDENEMFTLYVPKIEEYLSRPYDWTIAPSNMWRANEQLYRELIEDPNLNVFVFDVRSSAFDINEVFRSIDALSYQKGEFNKLRVTEANLRKVFDEFTRFVFGGEKWLQGVKKIGAQETVSIFIQSILASPEIYIVPTKKNVLHLRGDHEIPINASNYDAFFSRYDRRYSTKEIAIITAVADQLIKEVERRFHGDFWTPTIWADRAIQMMDQDLGPDWRENYVVWDPAAGTKNLTRDYKFSNLFSSTLHQSEIDMSRNYNTGATVFQYDFLNDDIDISPATDPRDLKKMPAALFEALRNNKPIIFYTNPPYGQATNAGADGTHKAGIADTEIGKLMRQENLGHATLELYTQFIYRVQKLTRDFQLTHVFFFFFNKGFLVSPAFAKFTDQMLEQFQFKGGFMLNAGEFQGTSSAWGIIFSYFQLKRDMAPVQKEFTFSIEKSGIYGIEKVSEHTLRRVTKNDTISSWLGEIELPKEEFNEGKYPQMSSAFNKSQRNKPVGKLYKNALGYMVNVADSVQKSSQDVYLLATSAYMGHGTSVISENFERACVTFASRKSILPNATWINDKDIFRRPSEAFQATSAWNEFLLDSIVFSLFHRSSYQTSLRNFEYNGEFFDVYNEWFFMNREDITGLAEKYQLNEIAYDARESDERFVYIYLQGKELSTDAGQVLELGKKLMRETFAKRFVVAQDHPEWHLFTWDAGYYQAYKITTLFKKEFAPLMKEFSEAFTLLETKIRKQVYKDRILEK